MNGALCILQISVLFRTRKLFLTDWWIRYGRFFENVGEKDASKPNDIVREGGKIRPLAVVFKAVELYDDNRSCGDVPKVALAGTRNMKTFDERMEVNPRHIVFLFYPNFDIYERTKYMLQTLPNRRPKRITAAINELNFKGFRGVTLTAPFDISAFELKCVPHCNRITKFVR